MRRIVTIILSTVTILVLLFGYHTSTNNGMVAASPMVQQPSSAEPVPPAGPPAASGSSSSRGSAAPKPSPARAPVAYTGDVADTQWGPVQVQITVRGGRITRARALQYPQGSNTDAQINSYALPILDQEVVQKQSVSIDTISGATVTSDGYLQSLQSAIDQAHL
jgi:uncharacterized protein with FMN-binding domain